MTEIESLDAQFALSLSRVDLLTDECDVRRGAAMLSSRTVVLILGGTSAGKSSLVNTVYGVELKRTSAGAEDKRFTIVEAVDELEFERICGAKGTHYRGREARLSVEELRQSAPNRQNSKGVEWGLARESNLYVHLDAQGCIERYGSVLAQLPADVLARSEPFQAMLVNASYVDERHAGARDVVVIDSEGLDFDTPEMLSRVGGNLQMLELFYRLSDRVVFLVRAGGMGDAPQAFKVLELLLGLQSLPPARQKDVLEQVTERARSFASSAASHVARNSDMVTRVVISGIQAVLATRSSVGASSSGAASSSSSSSSSLQHTVALDKLSFAISQMDACVDEYDEMAQVYQLGLTLGQHFSSVGKPRAEAIFPISIPAPYRRPAKQNALASLLNTVFAHNVLREPKRVLRERELQDRLRLCQQAIANSCWLRVRSRNPFSSLPPPSAIEKLIADSRTRQRHYSRALSLQPLELRAKL
jgi:hypothetical protein